METYNINEPAELAILIAVLSPADPDGALDFQPDESMPFGHIGVVDLGDKRYTIIMSSATFGCYQSWQKQR